MAILKQLQTGAEFPITARYIVGRSRTCQLRIQLANVSALHAELVWSGSEWQLLDLGSRNGTFTSGQRVAPGQRVTLARGAKISFGDAHAQYCFVDDSPPRLIVFAPDEVLVAEGRQLCLPSRQQCEALIFCSTDERWVVETAGGTRPLEPEDSIVVGGRSFQIHLPGSMPTTSDVEDLRCDTKDEGLFEFIVSRDGEHVDLLLHSSDRVHAIESRAHAFLLLALARARLDDASKGDLPESEHGWMYRDELMKELGVNDPQLLNLWVYRARQQVAQMKLCGASIIERREGVGQLRLGLKHLRIIDA